MCAGGRLTACMLTPARGRTSFSRSESDSCVLAEPAAESCLNHGADRVLALENERFGSPRADLFAGVLAEAVKEAKPKLVLIALTDFGRELAACAAARCLGRRPAVRHLRPGGEGGSATSRRITSPLGAATVCGTQQCGCTVAKPGPHPPHRSTIEPHHTHKPVAYKHEGEELSTIF